MIDTRKIIEEKWVEIYTSQLFASIQNYKSSKESVEVKQMFIISCIEKGADLAATKLFDGGYKTPMQLANARGQDEIVKIIAENAMTNSADAFKFHTALLPMVEKKNYSCVTALLKANTPIKKYAGTSPLHRAIKNDDIEMVKLLLSHGADLAVRDDDNYTPIMYAAFKEYDEIIAIISQTAKTNSKDSFEYSYTLRTLINRFSQHDKEFPEQYALIKSLLEAGAKPDYRNHGGSSSLHAAARRKESKLTFLLLLYGANTEIKNGKGKTPIDLRPEFFTKDWFLNQCNLQMSVIAMVLAQGLRQNTSILHFCSLDILQRILIVLSKQYGLPAIDANLMYKTALKVNQLPLERFLMNTENKNNFFVRACLYQKKENIKEAFDNFFSAIRQTPRAIHICNHFVDFVRSIKDINQLRQIDVNKFYDLLCMLPGTHKEILFGLGLEEDSLLHQYFVESHKDGKSIFNKQFDAVRGIKEMKNYLDLASEEDCSEDYSL